MPMGKWSGVGRFDRVSDLVNGGVDRVVQIYGLGRRLNKIAKLVRIRFSERRQIRRL